jgi:cytochrome c oxidase subunit I+III
MQLTPRGAMCPGSAGSSRRSITRRIAARYIVTALLLMFLAGMLALDMRWQLSVPENTRMTPQLYNESFSLHGSTMLFLVSVPIMEAMAFWLVPLMLGARNMAFPGWVPSASGSISAAS